MSSPTELATLVRAAIPRLYAFAYVMCGARDEAFVHVREALRGLDRDALLAAEKPGDVLLGKLARGIEESLGRKADHSFVILDNLLRSEETQPIDPLKPPIEGDLARVPVLLWELKRTCLASVLGALPPGVRVSFVVTDLFGFPPAAAAELLGIKESAFRVRLTRARRRLEDYLAPRCGHIDRHNPCYCEGRLNLALETDFVKLPPHTADVPAAAYNDEPEHRDIAELYRTLPPVQPTPEQHDALVTIAVGDDAVPT
ncbi:RNA polymerase, sigma subunit, ECF family [Nannocystis exedens]|uniref:RNA polymerase, sigma subunit, ECF family n=1 Tax=Nannocystis exedens TaxID=54 RepID=A0A1I1YN83_9BACT|nr:sigma factor-like helix-turn-helix DNA-binding protein [Nannocystis exedens]PCC70261.1 RNA polymerase sigma subunit [Nannocystis exedens]SFE20967.1 RNA polymerase, sigma subunit, ECF family [Nannocystis exedens]